ncbi:hypothetical protein VNO77_11780 [Canavalia gladiata]|uniref:Uncharacterized protein n=1 Tax=Canavalia gladiata TaxID=3824 RepID=A0AAN9LW00_CANGL
MVRYVHKFVLLLGEISSKEFIFKISGIECEICIYPTLSDRLKTRILNQAEQPRIVIKSHTYEMICS